MVLDIVIYGDPVLREKCPRAGEITDEMRTLADNMVETMVAAEGVGLAAPQVGVALQLAVVDVTDAEKPMTFLRVNGQPAKLSDWMPLKFVNPELSFGPAKAVMNEGCLSFPDVRCQVTRPDVVKAKLTLLDGRTIEIETDGLLSRAIQHETDHLNGVLFIDRASPAKKLTLKRRIQEMYAELDAEQREKEREARQQKLQAQQQPAPEPEQDKA